MAHLRRRLKPTVDHGEPTSASGHLSQKGRFGVELTRSLELRKVGR